MKGIEKITIQNRFILVVDYSDCKENEMIRLVSELKKLIIAENSPQLILAVFNNKAYATRRFMRHAEKETKIVIQLIDKLACVGMNNAKKLLLIGYNFLFRRSFKAFDTKEDALNYLIGNTKVDENPSAYYKHFWP